MATRQWHCFVNSSDSVCQFSSLTNSEFRWCLVALGCLSKQLHLLIRPVENFGACHDNCCCYENVHYCDGFFICIGMYGSLPSPIAVHLYYGVLVVCVHGDRSQFVHGELFCYEFWKCHRGGLFHLHRTKEWITTERQQGSIPFHTFRPSHLILEIFF